MLFQVLTEREETASVAIASNESFSGCRTRRCRITRSANYGTDCRHRIDVIRSDTKDSLRANQSAAAEIQPIDGSEHRET
jgi:hypothetical protein